MIRRESFSREWIESFRQDNKTKIDLMILEKMIRALFLVELLKVSGVEFIFKGGTSIALLLNNPQRFSIDIDIITSEKKDVLKHKMDLLFESSEFLRYEENVRSPKGIDISKAHYKFYYNSVVNNRDNYILLDILFEDDPYPETVESEVKNIFLDIDGEITKVKTPSIDSITGDKLTAFAPNSIGILYSADKDLEIIKQLFDIGKLFDVISDFKIVRDAYIQIAQKEIEYRNLSMSFIDSLNDTINTAILISRRDRNTGENLTRFNKLLSGIRGFTSFTINSRFIIDDAIEAAAKAALLAAKIKTENFEDIQPFDGKEGIRKYIIENNDYNFLNRLSRLSNKALYYWHQTVSLL